MTPRKERSVPSMPHGEPERGGLDPEVPTVITGWQVSGPFRIGHTTCLDDPATPIVVREADTVLPGPDGLGYAEGRCRRCVAKPFLASPGGRAMLILEHEPRCPRMEGLLREAGAAT
jgi:hypothetical protein